MTVFSVFDYFKEAFSLNRMNKVLYRPQLALIFVKVVAIAVTGTGFYNWLGTPQFQSWLQLEVSFDEVWPVLLNASGIIVGLAILFFILKSFLEAGLFNMYKSTVTTGKVQYGDFLEGAGKYFFKFLLGDILIGFALLLLLPLIIIAGLITLTIGFALIAILLGVFLMMWKISLVHNDFGIINAVKDSFLFAKKNFWGLTFLYLIHKAFVSTGSIHLNPPTSINYQVGPDPVYTPDINLIAPDPVKIAQILVAILVPVIAIITLTVSLIRMIFDVFFSLTMFVIYKSESDLHKRQVTSHVVS